MNLPNVEADLFDAPPIDINKVKVSNVPYATQSFEDALAYIKMQGDTGDAKNVESVIKKIIGPSLTSFRVSFSDIFSTGKHHIVKHGKTKQFYVIPVSKVHSNQLYDLLDNDKGQAMARAIQKGFPLDGNVMMFTDPGKKSAKIAKL